MMNKKQLLVLWLGIFIVLLLTIFPPTAIETVKIKKEEKVSIDYYKILQKECPQHLTVTTIRPVFLFSLSDENHYNELLYAKMFLCHYVVFLVSGGLIITLKTPKQDN